VYSKYRRLASARDMVDSGDEGAVVKFSLWDLVMNVVEKELLLFV